MYYTDPFKSIGFRHDVESERADDMYTNADIELTYLLGDWEKAERESCDDERYISETDYFAGHPDEDHSDPDDEFYADPEELDGWMSTGHPVTWCEACRTFTAHKPWGTQEWCIKCEEGF